MALIRIWLLKIAKKRHVQEILEKTKLSGLGTYCTGNREPERNTV